MIQESAGLRSFADMPSDDLDEMTARLWDEVRSHPGDASCACPAAEVVKWLLHHGYRILPPPVVAE